MQGVHARLSLSASLTLASDVLLSTAKASSAGHDTFDRSDEDDDFLLGAGVSRGLAWPACMAEWRRRKGKCLCCLTTN